MKKNSFKFHSSKNMTFEISYFTQSKADLKFLPNGQYWNQDLLHLRKFCKLLFHQNFSTHLLAQFLWDVLVLHLCSLMASLKHTVHCFSYWPSIVLKLRNKQMHVFSAKVYCHMIIKIYFSVEKAEVCKILRRGDRVY